VQLISHARLTNCLIFDFCHEPYAWSSGRLKANGGNRVKRRILIVVALTFLFAVASTYAQATDFLELVKTGTPQSVQAAINQGADVNAQDKTGWTALDRKSVV
jgi:hypothetical protein